MPGGKVQRKGTGYAVNTLKLRHKRNCSSTPATPANVALVFRRRQVRRHREYRGVVTWDQVTEDVAGRALNVETNEVELRAVDASGDPVETQLQAKAARTEGRDFTVNSGTAPIRGRGRAMDSGADSIEANLSGLTAGIECQVAFYARKGAGGDSPNLQFEIRNVTNGTQVATKNASPDQVKKPNVIAERSFTPAAGKAYQVRVSYVSGSGTGIVDAVQWYDKGNAAVWDRDVKDPKTTASFRPLARPGSWFYQARVRTLNRVHGGRCWSNWSGWTTPTQPTTEDVEGPPVPDGLIASVDRVEGRAKHPWRLRVSWNEIGRWIPFDADAEDSVDRYNVEMQVGPNGSTVANTRRMSIAADETPDDDDITRAKADFFNLRGKKYYRARVRAVGLGRRGAWSSWTSWVSPNGAPGAVQNLEWDTPTPAIFRAKWDPPADPTDVDRYRVEVIRATGGGGTVMDDGYTSGTRWQYHIPPAHRDQAHRVRVRALEDDPSNDVDDETPVAYDPPEESLPEETADNTNAEVWGPTDLDIDAIVTEVVAVLPPPDPYDGDPPAAATGLILQGGVGFIFAKWDASTGTTDIVTYDVHVSTSTGFTPGAGTLLVSVSGTFAFIRTLADETALAYDTTYYVKIVARDPDGTAAASTEASAVMVPATGPDIAVGGILAEHILSGQVTADKLAGMLVLGSTIVGGVEGGARVELDVDGFRLFDSDGTTRLVDFPTDPLTNPSFAGEVNAFGLDVEGSASLRGDTTIEPGGNLLIAGAITDPVTKPTASWGVPETIVPVGSPIPRRGLWYDASGSAAGGVPTFITCRQGSNSFIFRYIDEIRKSDGVVLRTFDLGSGFNSAWGVVCVGIYMFVLYTSGTDTYIKRFTKSDWTLTSPTVGVTSWKDNDFPGFMYDGTYLCLITTSSTSTTTANVRLHRFTAGATPGFNDTVTLDSTYDLNGPDMQFFGGVRLTEASVNGGAAVNWIALQGLSGAGVQQAGVIPFSVSTGTKVADAAFPYPTGAGSSSGAPEGITHDGTQFWSTVGSSAIRRFTNWSPLVGTLPFWIGYTWRDGAGTTHETLVSPRQQLTKQNRMRMSFYAPTIPGSGAADDPDRVRFYINDDVAEPTASGRFDGRLQLTTAVGVISGTVETFTSGGAQNPATNDFTANDPGELRLLGTNHLLARGDGYIGAPPTGSIVMWPTATAPAGWVKCDGTAYDGNVGTEYAGLYAVIGSSFGGSIGAFLVPDLRSRVPMGVGTYGALGATEGDAESARTADHAHSAGTLTTDQHAAAGVPRGTAAANVSPEGHLHAVTGITTTALTNTQFPHLSLNFIIKL